MHPGVVSSDILKEANCFIRCVGPLFMRLVGRSAATGASGSVYLALSPEMEGRGGYYLDQEEHHRSSPLTYNAELANQLWNASVRLVEAPRRVTHRFTEGADLTNPYPSPPPIQKKLKIPWKLIVVMLIMCLVAYWLFTTFV